MIQSERLGQAIRLECVIDRLRNQDVIVTADKFDRTSVRVIDRVELSETASGRDEELID